MPPAVFFYRGMNFNSPVFKPKHPGSISMLCTVLRQQRKNTFPDDRRLFWYKTMKSIVNKDTDLTFYTDRNEKDIFAINYDLQLVFLI